MTGVLDAFLDFALGSNADSNTKCRESLNDDLKAARPQCKAQRRRGLGFTLGDGLRTAMASLIDR